MSIKKILVLVGLVASFGASAQMPVPLLDGADSAAQAQARKQLETLLACKGVKSLDAKAVAAQFQALGLVKGAEGFYLPAPKAETPMLFGDQVLAALVNDDQGEAKATVYLKTQTGKQLAKKLGATQIDEQANTDDPSYFKKTGKTGTLLVGSAAVVFLGNWSVKYQSAVACQIAK